MKELTIEEKAKAYDEAIRKAKDMLNYKEVRQEDMEYIFPELKESDGEEIRKALIRYHKSTIDIDGIKGDEIVSWLEKQGEHSPVVIIPKFRVGDNIKTANEEPLTITKIDEKGYWSDDLLICSFGDAAKWELVEQKPNWSEEDEKIYQSILDDTVQENQLDDTQTKWLKSLKYRVQSKANWKPTEEQIMCLQDSIDDYHRRGYKAEILGTLLKQLKKLTE